MNNTGGTFVLATQVYARKIASFKGHLRSKKKLSSNERARKMQKNEPLPTSMRQMVLEIFHFKVRNLGKVYIAIL